MLNTSWKMFTGQSTPQHIHEKLIEKAKEKLSATAYESGFELLQSFRKLSKPKQIFRRLSLGRLLSMHAGENFKAKAN